MEMITDIKNKNIRIFPLQTEDFSFVLQADLPSSYLISLFVDKIWINLSQIWVTYIYPLTSFYESFIEKIKFFKEDYFIFYLENFFHSSDYAYNFILKILPELEKYNKKIIIHSLKTPKDKALEIIKNYKNVVLFLSTDIEYFFLELLYKKTKIENIANIIYKDSENKIIINKEEELNYDLWEYILWAYHNKYYTNFPKSKDEIINHRLIDKKRIIDDNIFYAWSNEKYIKNINNLKTDSIMLTTWKWCKYNCSYCYRWAKYKKVRQVPLETIKKDLEYISKLWYKKLYLFDDCFITTNLNRFDEIINLFNNYELDYQIATRYEVCSIEKLEKISNSKIKTFQIWLQSTSINANIESKRIFNKNKFEEVIQKLKDNQKNVYIDLILWLPWETIKDFINTFNYAFSLNPSSIFINQLFLNPKTELYENKEKYWIISQEDEWIKKDFYVSKIISSNNFTKNDIIFAQKYITKIIEKYPNKTIILR